MIALKLGGGSVHLTVFGNAEGWLYLAVMLDLFARKVVGWATSPANDTVLALPALDAALAARRPPAGLVHHSGPRQPLRKRRLPRRLKARGIVASMSRTGHGPHRRLHRVLLQPAAAPLVPRLAQPH